MSAQHTPGLLTVRGGYSLYAGDGAIPVADVSIHNTRDVCEADARRLAAAWNACDGIDTKRLEDLGRPLRLHLFGADERAERMVKDQAELREALTFAIRFHDQLTPADAERMRKVLDKATGGAA